MRYKKFASMLMLGFLMFSLTVTSWGGAYATAALAAEVGTEEETSEDTAAPNKAILGGLLAIGLIAAFSGHHDSNHSSASNSGTTTTATPSADASTEEQQAVTLLNQDRAANGLPALKVNSKLTALAESYAQDMIDRNYFSHYNPEGQSPFDRMNKAGIGYSYAGENLAINTNVTAAETAFMNSSGHRDNILNSNYTEVGIGVKHDSKGSVYVVQEFIKP